MLKPMLAKFKLLDILIIVFLFLFIYSPRLYMPFSFVHILTVISLYYLLTKYFKTTLCILKSKELGIFILMYCFITSYLFIIICLTSGDLIDLYSPVSIMIEIIPCAIFISVLCTKRGYDIGKIYNLILAVGMLQVICVVLSIISPDLRNWMIKSSGSPDLVDLYDQVGLFRIYGLAAGYTYSMPLFLGLCVVISYVLGMFRSYKYFFLIPFYLLSIAVNARTALVSIFIVCFVTLLFKIKENPYKQVLYLISLALIILVIVQIVGYQAENSSSINGWVWFDSGIKEIMSLSEGELEGNLSALGDTMWFMPKGFDILIGSGEKVFARSYESSDIGYVINLHYGGLFLSLLLYLPYFWLLIKSITANICEKIINLSALILLFIANAKGDVFSPNEVIKGVLLLVVFSIASTHTQIKSAREVTNKSCTI